MIRKALSKFIQYISPKQIQQPELGEFNSGWRDDYATTNIRKLTPDRLNSAIRDSDQGEIEKLMEVFEIVEQDDEVTVSYRKRRRAAVSQEIIITPFDDDVKSVDAADLVRDQIYSICGFQQALYDLSDAIGKGFSIGQPVWDVSEGQYRIAKILRWPQLSCRIGHPTGVNTQDQDEIRIIVEEDIAAGRAINDFAPGQWIAHVHKTYSQPLARSALFRSICFYYLFKHWSFKSWMQYTEKFGMPMRIGKYSQSVGGGPGSSDQMKRTMTKALEAMGRNFFAVIPDNMKIELIETKLSSGGQSLTYPALVDKCNQAISKAIIGDTMANEQGDKGARSLGEVYERARFAETENDCLLLAETLRRDLITPLVKLNMGDGVQIPWIAFKPEMKRDLDKEIERDLKFVSMLPVKAEDLYEKYGHERPEEGEEIVFTGKQQTQMTEDQPLFDEDPEDPGDEIAMSRLMPFAKKKSQVFLIQKMLQKKQ